MLSNLEVIWEMGRQKCFELGNPFYYKDADDEGIPGNERDIYYRKELPSGELFLVTIQVEEVNGDTYSIKDTIIRQLSVRCR